MDIASVGSYVLTFFALVGVVALGRKHTWAWLFNAGAQLLWVPFGAATGQYGFVLSGFIFFGICLYNWRLWRKEEKLLLRQEEQ